MYIHNDKTTQSFHLKERMLAEVAKSIEIAYELCDLFIQYNVEMEVHADINTNPQFKSNDALKEAMGYILGMGFAFKAKPEAFASSCCAYYKPSAFNLLYWSIQANTSSTPVLFSALVTKPCGKNCNFSFRISKNDFTFRATTPGFSLSDLVKITV